MELKKKSAKLLRSNEVYRRKDDDFGSDGRKEDKEDHNEYDHDDDYNIRDHTLRSMEGASLCCCRCDYCGRRYRLVAEKGRVRENIRHQDRKRY